MTFLLYGGINFLCIMEQSHHNTCMADPVRTITNEASLLDITANGGRFILIPDSHYSDDKTTAMMATLARSRVSVLGMEFSPELNPLFSRLQNSIRTGISQSAVEGALADKFDALGVPLEHEKIEKLAQELREATDNGIRVVGIDSRDNPEFIASLYKSAERVLSAGGPEKQKRCSEEFGKLLFGQDKDMAHIAERELAKEPDTSRMAVRVGYMHALPGEYQDSLYPNHPRVFADELRSDGQGVTIVMPFTRAALNQLPIDEAAIDKAAAQVAQSFHAAGPSSYR